MRAIALAGLRIDDRRHLPDRALIGSASEPTGVTVAGTPAASRARSVCGSRAQQLHLAARGDAEQSAASRRRPPGRPRRCGSRTRPAVGARTSSRPMRARVAPSWASATRTRAAAASRVARLRSRSAWLTKPRRDQRLGAVELVLGEPQVGARRPRSGRRAAPPPASGPSGRSPPASGRRATHWPGSTSTRTTWPPSPGMPTGMSRRAASEPVAEMTAGMSWRPGTTTVTAGSCCALFAAGRRGLLAAAAEHEHGDDQQHGHDRDSEDDVAPPAATGQRLLVDDDIVERVPAPFRRFEVHRFHRPHSGKRGLPPLAGAVLAE